MTFLDRNSYDLLDPLLVNATDMKSVVQALRTTQEELPETIAAKVLASIKLSDRLVTVGLVAELTLRDEDFIEAHLEVAFDTLEQIIELVRRAYLAAGAGGDPPVDGSPRPGEPARIRQWHLTNTPSGQRRCVNCAPHKPPASGA